MVDYNRSWDIWADNRLYGATPRHIRNMVRRLICNLEYNSILDVGCGNGSFLQCIKIALKKPKLKLAGIDLSENAIEISKTIIPNAVFKRLDIEKDYLDSKFDLIVCNDVLEHLNNDIQALKNIRKMASRYFICNTIQGKMHESEKLVGHVRNYTKDELIEKLKIAGFKPLKITEWGFPFYNLLHRKLNIGMTQGLIYGKYGFFKKALSYIVYLLFKMNSQKRGDILIILSEVN